MTENRPHDPPALALLAHELRTPLNAVIGYADAMREQTFGPLPDRYREQAALIHAAACHLLTMVEAMTVPERRIGSAIMQRDELDQLLRDTARLVAAGDRAADRRITVATAGSSPPVQVRADRVALRQIMINLIDNAVKFAAPGGAVQVTADREEGEVRISVANAGGAGQGTGAAGQGLGLALARTLAAAMGGTLVSNFPEGGGGRAVVRLPAADS